ncbi:MAG: hypothetical protein R2706_16120 [Acidimicrobiales bacterium]
MLRAAMPRRMRLANSITFPGVTVLRMSEVQAAETAGELLDDENDQTMLINMGPAPPVDPRGASVDARDGR